MHTLCTVFQPVHSCIAGLNDGPGDIPLIVLKSDISGLVNFDDCYHEVKAAGRKESFRPRSVVMFISTNKMQTICK